MFHKNNIFHGSSVLSHATTLVISSKNPHNAYVFNKGSDTVFLGDKHLGLCSSYFEITRKLLELWIDRCDSLEKHQTDRREMKVAKQACSKRGKK